MHSLDPCYSRSMSTPPEFMADFYDDIADDKREQDYAPVDVATAAVQYGAATLEIIEDIPYCTGVEMRIVTNLNGNFTAAMQAQCEKIARMFRVPAGHAGRLPIPGAE